MSLVPPGWDEDRFLSIEAMIRRRKIERFVREMNEFFERLADALVPFVFALHRAAEQISALFEIWRGPSAEEIRTRRVVQAQRRRRHR